jgi:hypothetical protein
MKCLQCGHDSLSAVGFCGRCGAKLDFTADEIAGALVTKATVETAANTEFYAKRALMFSLFLFLAALTLYVLSAGEAPATHFMPSAARGSSHTDLEVKVEPVLPRLEIPIESRKR